MEHEIAAAEKRKEAVEVDLASDATYRDGARARELSVEYRELTTSLAYLYDEWTRIQEEVESLAD